MIQLVAMASFAVVPPLAIFGVLALIIIAIGATFRRRYKARRTARLIALTAPGDSADLVVCDYVDEKQLKSFARQRGLEPNLIQVERTEAATAGASATATVPPGSASVDVEEQDSQTDTLKPELDPGVLVLAVISALDSAGFLRKDLASRANLGVGPAAALLAELRRPQKLAQQLAVSERTESPRGQAATNLVRAISQLLVADEGEQKRQSYEEAAGQRQLALVESEWAIACPDDGIVRMSLLRLKGSADARGSLTMPEGVALEIDIAEASLTAEGRRRFLSGARLSAGVLGKVSGIKKNGGPGTTLQVTPFAIFERLSRDSDHTAEVRRFARRTPRLSLSRRH